MKTNPTQSFHHHWLLAFVHLSGTLPLVSLGWSYVVGNLGFNPVEVVIRYTGRIAVVFLMWSLTCTPIHNVFNLPAVKRLRTPLGLYAALYATMHFAAFAAWDFRLDLRLIWMDILNRPFILIGLLALVFLALLAATSIRLIQRKLGKTWRRLHQVVYLVGILVIAHYLMAVKGDLWSLQGNYTPPLVAGGVLITLFILRWPLIYRPLRRLVRRD